ncbi:CoA transferase [Paenarthrobacter sp. RAF54_2]|uniref:CoA transferase n=1 Tax=Paenarthrobacter sp. RAF54_2 TaxID=3233061 RepID=UPI003F95DCF9
MESVPDLGSSLRALDVMSTEPTAAWTGPRRWWAVADGVPALDVEGLALGAVRAAATGLNALTGTTHRYSVDAGPTAAAFDSLGHLLIGGQKPEGFAPLSGFRKTADGWIRLHANYPHHAARLMEAVSASEPADVDRALLAMTSLEAEDLITGNNGVAAAVRTREEWVAAPMFEAASQGPWISFGHLGATTEPSRPSSWVPSAVPYRALAGLKVLDLTRVIAGPVATRLLGALGADVLRIDPPHLPELTDAFIDSGFDKRSAEADFRNPDDLAAVMELLEMADVVIMGYRDGGLDRFGLTPDALLLRRPDLVVATLSAWGHGGPWQGRRGFDSLVQAACGIADRYGHDDDGGWRPGALPVQALDHATGYGLAAAVFALLTQRLATGLGGTARLSLARTAEELLLLPTGIGTDVELPEPDYHEVDSPYGRLRYVGPPITVDGVPIAYQEPPVTHGSSARRWR